MRPPASTPIRLRVLVVAALVAACIAPTAGASAATAPTFADFAGLHVVSVTQLSDRDVNVSVLSENLGRPVDVRILLPATYDAADATTSYPVLYLFHGTSGRASDWINAGDATQTTAPYQLITVMPDAGFNGDGGFWFTNWVDRTTSHGPSQYEDFFAAQLVPWVDANLHTIANRTGRAVAGLSQGGYGSAEMAARHPDMFVSMASFSGAPEIARDPEVFVGAVAVIEAIEVGQDRVPPFSELGSPVLDKINWLGHDPASLSGNLRGMSIDLWTGEGQAGPYDSDPPNAGAVAIEQAVYQSTVHFHQHLVDENIPHFYDDYIYGTHSWGYWARDLSVYVPMMMDDFAHPQSPATISYTSIDKQWSQWDYTVSFTRDAEQEFSALNDGTSSGFTLSGSGSAVVTTPPAYEPGSPMLVIVTGAGRSTKRLVTADPSGRLTIPVLLGAALPIGPSTVTVTIAPAS